MTKISAATLVSSVNANIKMPTGETGDKAISAGQLRQFALSNTALGAFSSPVTISDSGIYSDLTLAAHTSISFATSGHIDGYTKYLRIITDGTYIVGFQKPTGITLNLSADIANYTYLTGGTYIFAMSYINGEIYVSYFVVNQIPTFSNSKSGDFNGSNSLVRTTFFPEQLRFDNSGTDLPFSLAFWVHTDITPSGANDQIIAPAVDGTTGPYYQVVIKATTRRLRFGVFTNTTNYITVVSSTALTIGQWYHVVCTYDASETNAGLKIYIDGVLESTTDENLGTYTGLSAPNSSAKFSIGSYASGSAPMDGGIDEVMVFNKELNATEVTELYNGGVVYDLHTSSLLNNCALWVRFEDTVVDYGPSGILLEAVNLTYSTDVP